MAGYALTRAAVSRPGVVACGVLFVYLVPGSLMLIPMYLIIVKLRLQDTYTGLIIANMSFSRPLLYLADDGLSAHHLGRNGGGGLD